MANKKPSITHNEAWEIAKKFLRDYMTRWKPNGLTSYEIELTCLAEKLGVSRPTLFALMADVLLEDAKRK